MLFLVDVLFLFFCCSSFVAVLLLSFVFSVSFVFFYLGWGLFLYSGLLVVLWVFVVSSLLIWFCCYYCIICFVFCSFFLLFFFFMVFVFMCFAVAGLLFNSYFLRLAVLFVFLLYLDTPLRRYLRWFEQDGHRHL